MKRIKPLRGIVVTVPDPNSPFLDALLPVGTDGLRYVVRDGAMVDGDVHYRLWEKIVRALPRDPCGFPIRYAETMQPNDYGALGLAWKTAPNCGAALERDVRYHRILTNTSGWDLQTWQLPSR